MATDKRELLLVVRGKDEGAKRTLDGVGDAAEDAQDELGDFNRGLKKIDSQMTETAARASALRREIARSGDIGLTKDLEKLERELKRLGRQRKLVIPVEVDVDKDADLLDAGGRAAGRFSLGFSQRIGPLLAKAPMSPPLLAGVASASPAIASLIGGAVSAGAALGAVGLGVALAAKNEEVKKAGASLGKDLMTSLSRDADVFVQPVLEGIEELRAGFDRVEPNIRRAFNASAKHVPVLARAVADAADLAAEDFADIVENADPVIEVFAEHIPKAIGVTSGALKTLSKDSEDNAKTLDSVLTAAEISIGGTATALSWLAKAGAVTTSYQQDLFQAITNTDDASKSATSSTAGWDASFRQFASSTAQVNSQLETYTEMVDRLTSENLSAEQATIDLERAIDEATAAAKKNTDGISTNTEKGRANRQILIDLAEKSNNAAQKIYEQTHSQEAANAAAERGRKAFIAAAVGMGVARDEAERLAGQLFAIPSPSPKVKLETATAQQRLKVLQDRINGLKGKNISIGVYFQTHGRNAGDLKVPGGHQVREYGGPVKSGHAYVVGEKRAEVFVPDRDGTIIPSIEKYQRTASSGGWQGMPSSFTLVLSGPSSGTGLDGMFWSWFHESVRNKKVQLAVRSGQSLTPVVVGG